ncbi:hypothetical protein [Pseudomonas sp.]|uniref:hypothetical protein n=1 Tax=Pseudomonas sp. TaxID=306 RepID=UPI002628D63D|nr:hypothetical protein [Pseudomonas sp.]
MTYVREQTSAQLGAHMRSLKKMAGWFDPLSDRLWQEVEALQAELAGLRTGYEAYERVNAELKAENETLIAAAQALRDEWRKDQADAQRYRFLRNEVSSRVQDYCIVKKFWGGTFPDRILVLDGADAEIDEALGQGKKS